MNVIHSLEEMDAFAHSFCKTLSPGDCVILDGDLGAGKTHFVKGVGTYFNVEDEITSPTFPIIIEHYGDINLYHFDLYRIEHANELLNIGFYDYLNSDGICFIEWGIKFPEEIPDSAIYLKFVIGEDNERKISVSHWADVKSNIIAKK